MFVGQRSTALRGETMQQFEQIQKYGQENVDAAMKAFGTVSKNAQVMAVEATDYTKKAFEQGTASFEKLLGAKTLDKALEVQTEYVRTAFEAFVAQSTKAAELYTNFAKDAFKPFEGFVAKPFSAAK
jgi:hypothetical protein